MPMSESVVAMAFNTLNAKKSLVVFIPQAKVHARKNGLRCGVVKQRRILRSRKHRKLQTAHIQTVLHHPSCNASAEFGSIGQSDFRGVGQVESGVGPRTNFVGNDIAPYAMRKRGGLANATTQRGEAAQRSAIKTCPLRTNPHAHVQTRVASRGGWVLQKAGHQKLRTGAGELGRQHPNHAAQHGGQKSTCTGDSFHRMTATWPVIGARLALGSFN